MGQGLLLPCSQNIRPAPSCCKLQQLLFLTSSSSIISSCWRLARYSWWCAGCWRRWYLASATTSRMGSIVWLRRTLLLLLLLLRWRRLCILVLLPLLRF